jgi:hypothetical protein
MIVIFRFLKRFDIFDELSCSVLCVAGVYCASCRLGLRLQLFMRNIMSAAFTYLFVIGGKDLW